MRDVKATSTSKPSGFTLIELMIVLALAGIMLAVGIPSFNSTVKNNRLASVTNELMGAISFARIEAVKRGTSVHMGQGTGNIGWVVWVDNGATANQWDAGEEVRVWNAPPASVTVTATGGSSAGGKLYFVFSGMGTPHASGDFTICDDRAGEQGSKIDLLGSGVLDRTDNVCL